jgi:ubiquinone biosynthesis protein
MWLVPSSEKRTRYRTVASVLGRHGMGALNAQLGLSRFVPFRQRLIEPEGGRRAVSTEEHVRQALEELGATGIKLGQILSTRPDLLPPALIIELEKLSDRVPPVPTAAIIETVEAELHCKISDVFREFDETPLAGASIGQVHGAVLCDGTPVVVKVRKPGIAETVATDLSILAELAARAARTELLGQNYDIEALVDDFAWTLRAEMDYVREGRNADRLREALGDDPRVLIPGVHWPLTTTSVLVMDRVEGIKIADVDELEAAGFSRRRLARTSAEILMRQVFELGFFHADPHPGNFLVTADGRLALLDFGMVGELPEEVRYGLLQLMIATVRQDAEAVADALESLGVLRSPGSRDAVRRDIRHVLERYYGIPVQQFDLRQYIIDTLGVARRNRLQLPTELALVLKTVMMSEGLWRRLDPRFNAAHVAEPFVARAAEEMYSPANWGKRLVRASGDTVELGAYLPGQIRRIAARLDRGEFEVSLRHRDLDEALNRLSAMVTRLSIAVVTSAFIVGLPLLATVYEPPGWRVIAPAWFAGGVVIVVALLARLAFAGRSKPRR